MRFDEFEARAFDDWERIPDTYKHGIDGLRVEKRALPHPGHEDIYTLGECATEVYPSDFGGPDTIRSAVVLYHGSFRKLADLDPDFDWEHEIWETLTHELRHHLESLAAEDALEDVDYAADENFKRLNGEPFDPFFYQRGEPFPDVTAYAADDGSRSPTASAGDGPTGPMPRARRPETHAQGPGPQARFIEGDIFVELEYRSAPPAAVVLDWPPSRWTLEVPPELADVAFLVLDEPFEPPATQVPVQEVAVVLVRRHGTLAALRRMFIGGGVTTGEHRVSPTRSEA